MSNTSTEKGKVTGTVTPNIKQEGTLQKSESEQGKKAISEPKKLNEILEIISRNSKLVQERTLMQEAIDQLKEISFSSNAKIFLTIKDESKDYREKEQFSTFNMKAIKICVETLLKAFDGKKAEIETQINLN